MRQHWATTVLAVIAAAVVVGDTAVERSVAAQSSRGSSLTAVPGAVGFLDPTGPYEVVPGWPKDLSTLPGNERWTFGAAPADVRERHQPFTITYARRTLTGWVNAVLATGLAIEAIAEPHADEGTARRHPEVADTRIAPYFLILRARKPLG